MRAAAVLLPLAALVGLPACGDDAASGVGRDRAEQARQAALDAGLDADVAEFLSLAARGATATYRVTYPGPTDGSELVVSNRPPDRRVDVVVDGRTTETRIVLDGTAYRCGPEGDCERTDAFVPPPGAFTERSIRDLRQSLTERTEDFTFELRTVPVAGVAAECLVTRRRSERARPELAAGGTICLAPSGAVLMVDQEDERLEALDYHDDVDPQVFQLPGPDR